MIVTSLSATNVVIVTGIAMAVETETRTESAEIEAETNIQGKSTEIKS
jgi:hypothetical protein